MGDILTAACPCGYESDSLFVGCGFVVRSAQVPALCRTCHRYVTVDPSRPRVRCPTCRRKPDIAPAFMADSGPAEGQAFECPVCGATSAVFQECGEWD